MHTYEPYRGCRPWLKLVALLGASAAACEDFGPRVYTAQLYQADPGCLEAYVPIGLVQAKDLGSECEPVCLRLGDALHVSTVCAPYPAEASLETADAEECAAALAALGSGASCEETGAEDAGTDAIP
jgi:hypothetical protein